MNLSKFNLSFLMVLYRAHAIEPNYEPHSWNSQSRSLRFRYANSDWDGKWSDEDQIGVSGGGWNKVHAELTSRALNDGEVFAIIGTKQQVGVGLCIDSCGLESNYGLRWKYNCIGFYGDGTSMLATDEAGKEYTVPVDRSPSSKQGFRYNQSENCVEHIGSVSNACTALPEHFRGKAVRAVGQVWNSASAKLIKYQINTSGTCASKGYSPIYDQDKCSDAADVLGFDVTWGPHGGYQDVVDGCSIRFDSHLFLNSVEGTCDVNAKVDEWSYTECKCTDWMPCLCES